jgi:hypothetical protein
LAIDTDYDNWCELSSDNGEPELIWREDRMRRLLLNPETLPLLFRAAIPTSERSTSCLI